MMALPIVIIFCLIFYLLRRSEPRKHHILYLLVLLAAMLSFHDEVTALSRCPLLVALHRYYAAKDRQRHAAARRRN